MANNQLNIDVDTLATWLKEQRPVTILDVRPLTEREEWAIPENIHEDAYASLKSNDPNVFNDFHAPLNTPIDGATDLAMT
jgi:rhodanese-related sulfurtransferase